MALYLGITRLTPGFAEKQEKAARNGKPGDPNFQKLGAAFPESLPDTCQYVCSYATPGFRIDGAPVLTFVVVDAERVEDLQFIGQYYNGYLQFEWTPTYALGATKAEREAMQAES